MGRVSKRANKMCEAIINVAGDALDDVWSESGISGCRAAITARAVLKYIEKKKISPKFAEQICECLTDGNFHEESMAVWLKKIGKKSNEDIMAEVACYGDRHRLGKVTERAQQAPVASDYFGDLIYRPKLRRYSYGD